MNHYLTHPDDPAHGFDGPDARADGLTKREYFAIRIMQAMISSPGLATADEKLISRVSVTGAEALIAALNEPPRAEAESPLPAAAAPSSTPSPVQPPC